MTIDEIVVPLPTAPVRLLQVTAENNNKFYNMTPDGSSFIAEYGRVEVTSTKKTYPISKWASVYKDKCKGGYTDVTHLVKISVKKHSSEYSDIPDPKINELFIKLMGLAKMSVTTNYSISSDSVTQIQVDEAQSHVTEITKIAKIGASKAKVNDILLELYTVIPRRMKHVQDHLIQTEIKTSADLQTLRQIIDNEQKTLDVMAGQVSMHEVVDDGDLNTPSRTILEALGITVELCNDRDVLAVQKLMAGDSRELRNVYRVGHKTSRTHYDYNLLNSDNKKSSLFWHGSRSENWISILQTGLKIRPSNAILNGSMFGDGIYFADKYRKSAGYTSMSGARWTAGQSNTGFLALMDVHLGNQLEVTHHSHSCYGYTRPHLKKMGGYDSVFAKAGADLINNEYIVYDDNQSTIKYLIEVGR